MKAECLALCTSDYAPQVNPDNFKQIYAQLDTRLRSGAILDQFGQIMYSQFLSKYCNLYVNLSESVLHNLLYRM